MAPSGDVGHEAFDASWLALRETADAAARSTALAARLSDWCGDRGRVTIADLGAGGGSAMRWLSPRLGAPQHWRLIDADPVLLETALRDAPVSAERVQADIARSDLAGLIGDADIVSASAVLDLVSAAWIDRLVRACQARGAAAWLTLNVTGGHDWDPVDPADAAVSAAFATDQRRDKGFGPSLGPDAVSAAVARFKLEGFEVETGPSDWVLGADQSALLRQFVTGYADAAAAASPEMTEAAREWRIRRLDQIGAGVLRLRVGHQDLLALPR